MKWYLITFVLLMADAQTVYAQNEQKHLYPTKHEVYAECKSAVEIAEKGDLQAFMRTYCASQITGYLAGYIRMLPAQRISDPSGKCEHVYQEIYEAYDSVICIPKQWWKSETTPVELRVAKDLLSDMEKDQNNTLNDRQYVVPFVNQISRIYSCAHTNN